MGFFAQESDRMKFRALVVALVVLGGAQAARAAEPVSALEAAVAALPAVQVTPPADVDNPSAVCFTPSIDAVDSYEADLLRPDTTVLQTLNLGKPTPDASNVACGPINVQPVAFGVGYSVRVRSKAGTAAGPYAVSQNKFNRVPGGPTKVFTK